MKLSDYLIDRLVSHGVKQVFMLPGGGAMHLNDSLGKRRADIAFIPMLHEQAVSIAAEAAAKANNQIGVAMVTSGPAGTNAVTGCAGAWLDSMPCLFLSGQVKRPDLKGDSGLRQLGSQEVDIVSIVSPVTKYAVTITEPDRVGHRRGHPAPPVRAAPRHRCRQWHPRSRRARGISRCRGAHRRPSPHHVARDGFAPRG
jgi:acetolactate synthase-1/2/3 large subunit